MVALSKFGMLARKLRIDRGLTMADQSDALEITPSDISRYETGQIAPDRNYIDTFAKWIGADFISHQELRRSAFATQNSSIAGNTGAARLYRKKMNTLTPVQIRSLGLKARDKPDAG